MISMNAACDMVDGCVQLPGAEKYLNEEGRADKPISIDDDDDEEAGGQEQQVRAGRGGGRGGRRR